MIAMFEQMAVFAAGSVAALFIFMIIVIMLLGVFWAKTAVHSM